MCTRILKAWTQGTVVRSWLLDLLVKALEEDPGLAKISGYTDDSGEGRWTVNEAVDHAVPLPVISAALFARFASRQEDSPTMKAVAALRNQFGGHAVHAAGPASPPAAEGRWSVFVRHLQVSDFRSWEQADLALRTGPERAGRGQRSGQDQPGGGDRLPGHPRVRTGWRPTHRWSGTARPAPWSGRPR